MNLSVKEQKAVEYALSILSRKTTQINVNSASQAQNYVYCKLRQLTNEEFHVMYLTSQNEIIDFVCHFQGTINSCPVFPRDRDGRR